MFSPQSLYIPIIFDFYPNTYNNNNINIIKYNYHGIFTKKL